MAKPKSTTDGGCAKGMPRNLFVPFAVVPVNRPLSSVTLGAVGGVGVKVAKTVVAAVHIATSDTRREGMIAREKKKNVFRVPWDRSELYVFSTECFKTTFTLGTFTRVTFYFRHTAHYEY